MSDSNSMWPFQEISAEEGLDINEIFGTGTSNGAAAPEANPFQVPQQTVPAPEAATPHVEQPPTSPAASQAEQIPAPQPTAVTIPPATIPAAEPVPSNPLEAAFEAKTVENAKASLFEKKPVFCHKSAKEVIEDPTMTFEELRIRKSEDFLDLEEGKNVSWSVEYGTIRKNVKDPKGTTIISMKESIERSREFLDALKKAKDKNPDCIVRPKVTMKNKGTAAYKGTFPTVEAARNSDRRTRSYWPPYGHFSGLTSVPVPLLCMPLRLASASSVVWEFPRNQEDPCPYRTATGMPYTPARSGRIPAEKHRGAAVSVFCFWHCGGWSYSPRR